MALNRTIRRWAAFLVPLVLLSITAFSGMIVTAAATPYQAGAHAQCPTSTDCVLKFAAVPAGKRFDVQFASCEVGNGNGQTVSSMRIYLQTQQNGQTVSFVLARRDVTGENDTGSHVYSAVTQPVGLAVPAGQVLRIFAWPSSGYFADTFDCTVSGDMNDATAPGSTQFTGSAQCPSAKNCVISFPAIPANKHFETRFAACESRNAKPRYYLQTVQNGNIISTGLSDLSFGSQYDGSNSSYATSQPVMFSVPSQQVLKIVAWPGQGTSIDRMDCTVSGDMEDTSTPAPYQAAARAQCPTSTNCVVGFPKAAAALHVQFAFCAVRAANADPGTTRFYLQTQQAKGQYINEDFPSPSGGDRHFDGTYEYLLEGQPIEFDVPSRQQLKIVAWPNGTSYIDRMDCTIYGQLH